MKKQTNLLNPTPAQVKYRNRLWAKALLENERKARGKMYDEHGGRCCLAVAQDVAISCGVSQAAKGYDYSFPYSDVGSFFGWGTNNPSLRVKINDTHCMEEAAALNDGDHNGIGGHTINDQKITTKGLSHKQIAECVLNTFVHPSEPKQSFKLEGVKF